MLLLKGWCADEKNMLDKDASSDRLMNLKTYCNHFTECSDIPRKQFFWKQMGCSTKDTMDPEGSARNSCNSFPLYARWAD